MANPLSPYPHGNDTEVRSLKNDPYDRQESAVYGKLGSNGREEVDAFIQGTIPISGGLTDAQLRATPVPVSGTVTATGPLTDAQLRATAVPVSGTVATGGLTDTQLRATAVPISGTVTANLGTIGTVSTETTQLLVKADLDEIAIDTDNLALIKAKTDNLDVALSTRTKPSDQQHAIVDSGTVTISGTVPVSGPLTDTQLRATPVPVSGTVTATTGGLTDTQLRATPVPVSGTVTATGPLTDTQLRNSAVPVSGTFFQATQPVSGTFFQATQPVSGPVTDTQLRATPVPVSGTFFQATQPVSGTVNPTTPSALFGFVTAVPTAGTRVQLANHAVVAGILQAPSTNSGLIYVGDVTVSSSVYGAELQPGQASGIAIDNTNRIYIDSSVNGDKCAFLGS